MRRKIIVGFFAVGLIAVYAPAFAADEPIKLPYAAGEQFVVVQGYNSPPTHIKKDSYALDLSQDGCDAYGKSAVAATSGTVMLAQENGYNGGYGTQVLLVGADKAISRYAHMIPKSVAVAAGDPVRQGQPLGAIGNTGLVAGAACAIHPGTHLHFAMYQQASDGSFLPVLPEPISGYTGMREGVWYLSDNAEATSSPLTAVDGAEGGSVIAASLVASSSMAISSRTPSSPAPTVVSVPIPIGAVGIAPFVVPPSAPMEQASEDVSSSNDASSTASSDAPTSTLSTTTSSTLASSTETTADVASGTPATDSSTVAIATGTSANDTSTWTIALQTVDDTNSDGSWYSDNWFDLGSGFSGTLHALTLEGFVNGSDFSSSDLWLDEFFDSAYQRPSQTFALSTGAPFTDGLKKITIDGLDIPLEPDRFYRLRTYQNYQNRSVILAGTSATGTAMWDEFIYGQGGVQNLYSFYPYLVAEIEPPGTSTASTVLY